MDQVPPPGWSIQKNALVRTIKLADFVEALGFLLGVARLAESANHHPDVDLRYNQLHLSLCTHSAGHKITGKDFALAQKINDLDDTLVRSLTEELRRRLAA